MNGARNLIFLTSLVQIERRGENFCGKSHVHYNHYSQRDGADYNRISNMHGLFLGASGL